MGPGFLCHARQQEGEQSVMKLFASKLILHPDAQMRLRVRDRYSLHRVVMDLFEPSRRIVDSSGSQPSGIQWVDRGEHLAGREILILSDRMPKEQKLPEDVQLATKPIAESFLHHATYRFAVTVNPVITEGGRRVGLTNRGQILSWFNDRARTNGFRTGFRLPELMSPESFQSWISKLSFGVLLTVSAKAGLLVLGFFKFPFSVKVQL